MCVCVYTCIYTHSHTHICCYLLPPHFLNTVCHVLRIYRWLRNRTWLQGAHSLAETKAFVWLTLIRAVLGNVSSSRHLLSALISRSSARQPGAWRWPRHGSSGSWQNVGGRCLLCQNPGRSLQKSHCRWWGYQQLSLGAPAQPDSEELEGWKPPCRV